MTTYLRHFWRKKSPAFSLVEMLTAIFIMGVGMIGFSLLLSSTWKSHKFVLETGITSVRVNHIADQMVSNLRKIRQADNGDYPLESGDDFDLVVYLDIDNDGITERVHYYLSSGQLFLGTRKPTGASPPVYAPGDETTQLLSDYIVNTPAQPLFYYYNENYPGDTVNNPLATPVAVGGVRLIRVMIRMNIDPVHAPDNINIESFADLRNLESL